MIGRFLGRFPRIIASIILGALAVSAWQATVYVDTVVRPREAAARQAMIEREIGRADTLFSRAKFETALNEYDYVLAGYPDELPADVESRLRQAVGSCHVALAIAATPTAAWKAPSSRITRRSRCVRWRPMRRPIPRPSTNWEKRIWRCRA